MSKAWSTSEVAFLESHSADGAESVAKALGRTVPSVKTMASQYGLSMRQRWMCPRCGQVTYRPLSARTGWCQVCTKESRRSELEEIVRDMREEDRRDLAENRARQRLYAQMSRLRKKS